MNHINDRRVHGSGRDIMVRPQSDLPERLPQFLCIANVDGHEFENTILGYDAEDEMSICLAIVGNKRNPSSSGLEHTPARLVQRSLWVNGDCLWRGDIQCPFHLYIPCQFRTYNSETVSHHAPRRLSKRSWSILSKAAGFWK